MVWSQLQSWRILAQCALKGFQCLVLPSLLADWSLLSASLMFCSPVMAGITLWRITSSMGCKSEFTSPTDLIRYDLLCWRLCIRILYADWCWEVATCAKLSSCAFHYSTFSSQMPSCVDCSVCHLLRSHRYTRSVLILI